MKPCLTTVAVAGPGAVTGVVVVCVGVVVVVEVDVLVVVVDDRVVVVDVVPDLVVVVGAVVCPGWVVVGPPPVLVVVGAAGSEHRAARWSRERVACCARTKSFRALALLCALKYLARLAAMERLKRTSSCCRAAFTVAVHVVVDGAPPDASACALRTPVSATAQHAARTTAL